MEALLFLLGASVIAGLAGSSPATAEPLHLAGTPFESGFAPSADQAGLYHCRAVDGSFAPVGETTTGGRPCWVCGRDKDGHEHA